jgi:hypothetical protein
VFVGVGGLVGATEHGPTPVAALSVATIAAAALSMQFYRWFRYFSNNMTVTIYRDFFVFVTTGDARVSGGRDARGRGNPN